MKKFIFLIALAFAICHTQAQDYNILLIPDSLLKDANTVGRYSELHLTIISEKKAKLYKKRVLTILNEAGARYADYAAFYDQFSDINDINGYLYNAAGKELKTVRKKDISDHAAYDGYSLMLDDRYKEHNFYYNNYPYTVEYEETDDVSQSFAMPAWKPQLTALMSVQYSKLIVEVPTGFKFRYKQFNLNTEPLITQSKNNTIYTWEVKNIPTKKYEIFQPSWSEIMPSVLLAPSNFSINDYKGNMDSWQNYGVFMNQLLKDRDILPDEIKQKVHILTDNVKDPHEKINILYNYLQQNSRYVSVQLGVGGWQPFDAKYVAVNKYGDCKALSNFMIAMLKEAGLKANYVVIEGGEDPDSVQNDFPMAQQFNHVTVCVPLDKDSVWLECTSQTKAPGYAGTFTGNRYALLVNESGGHIVATPRYASKENQVIRNIHANIDVTGSLLADVTTIYTGCETDELHGDIEHLSKKDFDDQLKRQFDIPTYDISNYSYKETSSTVPSINEAFKLTAPNYSSVTGKRVFLKPNIITYYSGKFDTAEKRKYDIVLNDAFKHIDSVQIDIPAGYAMESLPKDVVLNTPYGNYSIRFKFENNIIYCVRYFEQNAARFPSTDYPKIAGFMNNINKADRSKMVFIKKDS